MSYKSALKSHMPLLGLPCVDRWHDAEYEDDQGRCDTGGLWAASGALRTAHVQ